MPNQPDYKASDYKASDYKASDYKTQIRQAVFDDPAFLRLSLTGAKPPCPWRRATWRPLTLHDRPHWQLTLGDGRQDHSHNLDRSAAQTRLDEILALPFPHIHLQTGAFDLHVRITKKGRPLVRRAKPSRPDARPDQAHNRVKRYPLPETGHDPLLAALDLLDGEGRVRPTRRDKFVQINRFLQLLDPMVPQAKHLRLIDCGCGSAYLTFAAYHYLHHIQGRRLNVEGIDRNPDLIAKSRDLRDRLGWSDLDFSATAIADFTPTAAPDITLSLHACDTATDEALAQGIRWNSRLILAAPCCQHELRPQLDQAPFTALRDGILIQRQAEVLTDALRAQLLRIMGYRTDIVEFIDSKHTPKNLLIRAVRTRPPGAAEPIKAYLQLRDFWQVSPTLEKLLAPQLTPFFPDQTLPHPPLTPKL